MTSKIRWFFISFLVILFSGNNLSASYIDSLQKIVEKKRLTKEFDTEFFNNYEKLVRNQESISPIKALDLCFDFLNLAISAKNKIAEQSAYNMIGNIYLAQSKYDKALEYYTKCLNINEEIQEWGSYVYSLSDVANIYYAIGEFQEAEKLYQQGLSTLKRVKEFILDRNNIYIITNNNLALTAKEQGKLVEALNYFNQSLEIAKKDNNYNQMAITHNYIARLYTDNNQFENAEKSQSEAIKNYKIYFKQRPDDNANLVKLFTSLATIYYRAKKFENARKVIDSAESYILDSKYSLQSSGCYYRKAKIYYELQEFDIAEKAALTCLQLASESQFLDEQNRVCEFLARFYEQRNDLSKSVYYFKESINIQQKVAKQNIQTLTSQLKFRNELKQKDEKIKLIEGQQELTRYIIILIGIIGVLSIVFAFIYYKKFREKERLSKQLKEDELKLLELNNAKDKFFSIISHDLKGPISAFQNVLELISDSFDEMNSKEVVEILAVMKKSNKNVYNLLENLLLWANSQSGKLNIEIVEIPIYPLVEEVIEMLLPSANLKEIKIYNNIDKNIRIKGDMPTISTIIRNLISNSIKFSHTGGKIEINGVKESNRVKIVVKDYGVGISNKKLKKLFKIGETNSELGTNNEKGTGLGLILVSDFVRLNHGNIFAESKEGESTSMTVELPLAG